MSDYGCPQCNDTMPGRCPHCRAVRFALPRTAEKDALMSPSMGEELCSRCGRHHGVGGVYYVPSRSAEERMSVRDRKINEIIAEDARRSK